MYFRSENKRHGRIFLINCIRGKHKPFRLVEIDDRLFHSYDYIKFAKHLTKTAALSLIIILQYTIQQGRRVQIRNNSNKIRNHAKQKIKHMVSWYG